MSELSEFPNADLLWSPERLQQRLGEENLVIVDLRSTHEVMSGIIPGAVHLDLYGMGLTSTTPEMFDQFIHLMRSQLGLRGVSMERTVVFYEEKETGVRAGRAFWLLEYFGHGDVHVLDGGIAAWKEAGCDIVREMNAPKASSVKIEPREEIFISADGLHGMLDQEDLVILDTRSDKEYSGQNKRGGPRGGTIPGSVHLEWVHYLDGKGRVKPPAELLALFEGSGVLRDKAIVPF